MTAVSYRGKHVKLVGHRANTAALLKRLRSKHPACVLPGERYQDMLKLYGRLKNRLGERDAIDSFEANREYEKTVRDTFEMLLLPVSSAAAAAAGQGAGLALQGAPAAPVVPDLWLEPCVRHR